MAEENTEQNKQGESNLSLSVLSSLVNRISLASRLGVQSYDGERNIYEALGYSTQLQYKDYLARYYRQDMAKAIIDRPVRATWKGEINVVEKDSLEGDTEFEKSWKQLVTDFNLKLTFQRIDKLTGIGRYSVLLLGTSDATSQKAYATRLRKGVKLVYLKPLSEEHAVISKWDNDPRSPRYGMPLYYDVYIQSGDSTTSSKTIRVHHSRLLHITEDVLEDEVFGTPRLEAVFNRLYDLEKLIGGDAEMFWRGARPGYVGKVDQDYEMTEQTLDDLKDQIKEFENNLRRVLVNEGVDYTALEQQIADPLNHVNVQIQMISAVTGIPKRILIGSERGELASSQDKQEWMQYVTTRREELVEHTILRPFINKCMEIGILPAPSNDYHVVWDRLFSLTDKEKMEIGKGRSVILKEYSANVAAQDIMPMKHFLVHFLGMDKQKVDGILEDQPEVIREPTPTAVGPGTRGTEIIKKEEEKRVDKEN